MPFCIERDGEDIWLRSEAPRVKWGPLALAKRYENIGSARSAVVRVSKASNQKLEIVEVQDDGG